MRKDRYAVSAWVCALLALAHAHLIGTVLLGQGTEPPVILGGHVLGGIVAGIATAACWRRAARAWVAVLAYGVVAALLTLAVGPALDLPTEARRGLLIGAAVLFGAACLSARHLRA